MSTARTLFAAVLLSAAAAPTFAAEADVDAPQTLGLSAGSAPRTPPTERRAFRIGDVSPDGQSVYVGGDAGWALLPKQHARRMSGGTVPSGSERGLPRSSRSPSAEEKKLLRETQIGG